MGIGAKGLWKLKRSLTQPSILLTDRLSNLWPFYLVAGDQCDEGGERDEDYKRRRVGMTSCRLKDISAASQSYKVPRGPSGLLDHCIFMRFDKRVQCVQTVQVAGYLSTFALKPDKSRAAQSNTLPFLSVNQTVEGSHSRFNLSSVPAGLSICQLVDIQMKGSDHKSSATVAQIAQLLL